MFVVVLMVTNVITSNLKLIDLINLVHEILYDWWSINVIHWWSSLWFVESGSDGKITKLVVWTQIV